MAEVVFVDGSDIKNGELKSQRYTVKVNEKDEDGEALGNILKYVWILFFII